MKRLWSAPWLPIFDDLADPRSVAHLAADAEAVPLFDYDAELRRYHQRLLDALDIQPGDRVLDIGCGAGQTTRDAARAASSGTALGIDVSAPMLASARHKAAMDGLRNAGFVRADAQTHAFPAEHFSLGISRFGTMFFSDPVAAFANIGRAMRPGSRLVQLLWQAADRQEWEAAIRTALTGLPWSPLPAGTAHDPFAMSEPDVVTNVLSAAGFTAVDLVDVREPIYYGPDADRACAAVLRLWTTTRLVTNLDAAPAQRAHERLRATLDAHDTGDGVWFDSRAWLVTAHRR